MEGKGGTEMKRLVLFFITLVLVITFTSARGTIAQEAEKESSMDVSGNWTGRWVVGTTEGKVTLVLQQNDDQITGIRTTSRLPGQSFPLRGNYKQGKFTWRSEDLDGSKLEFELKLKGNSLSGYGWHGNTQMYMSLQRKASD